MPPPVAFPATPPVPVFEAVPELEQHKTNATGMNARLRTMAEALTVKLPTILPLTGPAGVNMIETPP